MDLVYGGAYQGKTAFAKEKFGLGENDIFVCETEKEPSFDKKCISHIERLSYFCIKNGLEPADYFFEHADKNAVVISDDISCGIVPIDPLEREWREAHGRMLMRISKESGSVTRLFCGIGVKIK